MSVLIAVGSIKRVVAAALAILCGMALALTPARPSRAHIDALVMGVHALPPAAAPAADPADVDSSIPALAPVPAEPPLASASGVQPFGVLTAVAGDEGLREKWHDVRRAMASEAEMLARCQADRAHCPSVGATRFLAIVAAASKREGRARLGTINRAINLAIRPQSDLVQYGVIDRWAPPLDALARGAGDCEDYAIAKYAALRAVGIDDDDLRLMIVRDTRLRADHAVVAARLNGRWLVLDNRRLLMLEDGQLADYVPLFTLGDDGVRRVDGFSRQAEAAASRRNAL